MMRALRLAAALSACAVLTVSSSWPAATGSWPCKQRKVPEISAAAIWRGPPLDAFSANWRDDAAVSNLVRRLAARRTKEDEAAGAIAEFAKASAADRAPRLARAMAGLLETVNDERAEVIAGLERFGDAQMQMAELLRQENAELATLRSAVNADPSQIEQKLEQLNWNLRIFNERQKSLSSVCEVPVLLEQRLFAISKYILKAVHEGN